MEGKIIKKELQHPAEIMSSAIDVTIDEELEENPGHASPSSPSPVLLWPADRYALVFPKVDPSSRITICINHHASEKPFQHDRRSSKVLIIKPSQIRSDVAVFA